MHAIDWPICLSAEDLGPEQVAEAVEWCLRDEARKRADQIASAAASVGERVRAAEFDGLNSSDERFMAEFTVISEIVRHHVEEEEEEQFPKVREQPGDDRLTELGQQRLERYQELNTPPGAGSVEPSPSADRQRQEKQKDAGSPGETPQEVRLHVRARGQGLDGVTAGILSDRECAGRIRNA